MNDVDATAGAAPVGEEDGLDVDSSTLLVLLLRSTRRAATVAGLEPPPPRGTIVGLDP